MAKEYLKDLADERARELLGFRDRHTVTQEDVRDAERLLNLHPRDHMPYVDDESKVYPFAAEDDWGQKQTQTNAMKKSAVGLLGLGDSINAGESLSPLWDAIVNASDKLRDGVESVAPGVAGTIDNLDQSLFSLTGGRIGTPKKVTPEQQLNLRDHYRYMSKEKELHGDKRRYQFLNNYFGSK